MLYPRVDHVAKMIDHSLLRPELTAAEVGAGCALAARYQVMSVCVRPADVSLAVRALQDTDVAVGTVVGFPHGSSTTGTKVREAAAALAAGACEIDMVLNIGRLRSGDDRYILDDIGAVAERAVADNAILKVILETAYLTDNEKVRGCRLAAEAGADFVKTSTGFAPGGATLEDLRLMRASVPKTVGVKAAGGVRNLDLLLQMVEIGVTRFGATATAAILDDLTQRHDKARSLQQPNHQKNPSASTQSGQGRPQIRRSTTCSLPTVRPARRWPRRCTDLRERVGGITSSRSWLTAVDGRHVITHLSRGH